MNLIIYGPPGSGKSTQAKLLSEKLSALYIASGDITRQIAGEDTDEGRLVKTVSDQGDLAPDDILFRRIRKIVDNSNSSKGLVLDGYPRNQEQIFLLEQLFAEKQTSVDKVVVLDLSDQDAIDRLLKRAKLENRSDDTPATIAQRLQIYHQSTQPIIDYFTQKGLVIHINGHPAIEEVFQDICQKLGLSA